MTQTLETDPPQGHLPDDVSVRRWFAFYALFLLATGLPLAILLSGEGWSWQDWWHNFESTLTASDTAVKLLVLAIYTSLCCTFLPLPTGPVVAGAALQQVAVGDSVWTTALLVGTVAAAASTIANLNDYHLFTWLLRHHRVAKVRQARAYQVAARWFAKGPFFILVIFNFLPIPVDVVRMLATTYRYPRVPFAAANFIGRFARYAAIAAATYLLGREHGWKAAAALLVLAVVLGGGRLLAHAAGKVLRRQADGTPVQ